MKQSEKLIISLAADLKNEVDRIESKTATTKNNYGDYLGLFSRITNTPDTARILARALILAGANNAGVRSALAIHGGGPCSIT